MRILFFTHYYPPFIRGGYEQWCQEVAEMLVGRGHQVRVISSRSEYGIGVSEAGGVQVHRLIYPEVEGGLLHTISRLLIDRDRVEAENLAIVQREINEYNPDVALIWGMWNVPRSVPARVEQLMPGRVAYYLCDYWLSLPNAYLQRWQEPARHRLIRLPKKLLSRYFIARLEKEIPPNLELEHPICVSQGLRKQLVQLGVPVGHAPIIYVGTCFEEYACAREGEKQRVDGALNLLYLGRITAEKGVHTAIQAMAEVACEGDLHPCLDILGSGSPEYVASLQRMVRQFNLEAWVKFLNPIPREELPRLLKRYDALVFPSEWDEPFARIVLEGMAAGLVVIGTTTGGTGEVLIEGITGLTFPAGDAIALARQIQRLNEDEALLRELSRAGAERVQQAFTQLHMVEMIEAALLQLCQPAYPYQIAWAKQFNQG